MSSAGIDALRSELLRAVQVASTDAATSTETLRVQISKDFDELRELIVSRTFGPQL